LKKGGGKKGDGEKRRGLRRKLYSQKEGTTAKATRVLSFREGGTTRRQKERQD